MNIEKKREVIKELVGDIKREGLRAFVSESGTYGIYTDKQADRVVYFQLDFGIPVFSGCYQPSRGNGTGWRMTDENYNYHGKLANLLKSDAPKWANKNPKYNNLNSELKQSAHSNYQEII